MIRSKTPPLNQLKSQMKFMKSIQSEYLSTQFSYAITQIQSILDITNMHKIILNNNISTWIQPFIPSIFLHAIYLSNHDTQNKYSIGHNSPLSHTFPAIITVRVLAFMAIITVHIQALPDCRNRQQQKAAPRWQL